MKVDLSKLKWNHEIDDVHKAIGFTHEDLCNLSKRTADLLEKGMEDELNFTEIAESVITTLNAKEVQLMLLAHIRDLIEHHMIEVRSESSLDLRDPELRNLLKASFDGKPYEA